MIQVAARYAVRGTLIVCVLLAAWWVMPVLRPDSSEGTRTTGALAVADSGTLDIQSQIVASPFLFAELFRGQWHFHDSAWSIATRVVTLDQARREITAVPEFDAPLLTEPMAGEAKLLSLFQTYGTKSNLKSGHTRFTMNVAHIEAVGYAIHRDGQLRLVKASGLTTNAAGEVQLIEMKPKPSALSPAAERRLTMLLPDSAETIATRRDANNQVCAVVANTLIDDVGMQTFLEESGWVTQRSTMPNGPMRGLGAWICRKGKETVLVMLEPSGATNLLFVMRVPDDTRQS